MPLYTIRRNTNVSEEYRDQIILGKSSHSYFLNKKVTEVFNKDSWLGKRCFIVGGGESLKGFDFSRLDGELTIGINKAFKFFPNSTINYLMDATFYAQLLSGAFDKPNEPTLQSFWWAYKGVRVFLTPMELKEFGKEVYVVRRLLDLEINRKDLDHGISQSTNSGGGAICLAAALGANVIYLLGYDMECRETTHWHDGYEKREITKFNETLSKYGPEIELLKPLLDQAGVKVINLNKNSKLRCFPFADFEDVIGEKSADVS